METEFRVVIDTNVMISALLLAGSVPRRVFQMVLERGRILVSAETIAEVSEVLRRPKFDRYVSEAHRLEFLSALLREAELINVTDIVATCRDPRDDKFLELALSGHGTHIIGGDDDLLTLDPFRGVRVVTPLEFLRICEPETQPE